MPHQKGNKSNEPKPPSDEILVRAHEAQLNKMLGLIAVWFSLFIGLIGILVALIGTPQVELEWWVKGFIAFFGIVFAIGGGFLTMAILGKFQEIVFLEKQKSVGYTYFFQYLKEKKVRYAGARLWDWIVRNGVLGISDEQLMDERSDYTYSRMNKGLSIIMLLVWAILGLIAVSIVLILNSR